MKKLLTCFAFSSILIPTSKQRNKTQKRVQQMYVIKIIKGKIDSSPDGEMVLWNEDLQMFVPDLKDATIYSSVSKANKGISNMGAILRKGRIIGAVNVGDINDDSEEVPEVEPTEKLLYQVGDFKKTIIQRQGIVGQLRKNLKYLELKQLDLLHYAENYNFSASEGYNVLRQIKIVREERRKIKNALEFLERVGDLDSEKLDRTNIEQLDKHGTKYNPRVLKEMFKEKEDRIRRQNART